MIKSIRIPMPARAAVLASALSLLHSPGALAQPKPEPFPSKPITFINPLAAGGPQEVETRLYAQKIMENTGWKILVDFRVGAGGTLGQHYVVKAPPDGYTVLTTSSSYVGKSYRHTEY